MQPTLVLCLLIGSLPLAWSTFSSPGTSAFSLSPGSYETGPLDRNHLRGDENGFFLADGRMFPAASPIRANMSCVVSAIDMNARLIAAAITCSHDRFPTSTDLVVYVCDDIVTSLFGCIELRVAVVVPNVIHRMSSSPLARKLIVPPKSNTVITNFEREIVVYYFNLTKTDNGTASFTRSVVPADHLSHSLTYVGGMGDDMLIVVACPSTAVFRRQTIIPPDGGAPTYSWVSSCAYKDMSVCRSHIMQTVVMGETFTLVALREALQFDTVAAVFLDNTCRALPQMVYPSSADALDNYSLVEIFALPASYFATLLTYSDNGMNFSSLARPPNSVFLWATSKHNYELLYPDNGVQLQLLPSRFWKPTVQFSEQPYVMIVLNRIVFGIDSTFKTSYTLFPMLPGRMGCERGHSSMFCGHPEHNEDTWSVQCPPGTFKPFGDDMSPCLPCPKDSYAGHAGSITCTPLVGSELTDLVAPAWSIIPQPASKVYCEYESTSYTFPMPDDVKTPQNILLRSLFLTTTNTTGFPFFVAVMTSAGLIVVLGLVTFFMWRVNRRNRLFKIIRGLDAFKVAHMRMKFQSFIVYKSVLGGLLTIFLCVLAILSTAYVIQMALDYHPIYIGNTEDRIPQNSDRQQSFFSVGDSHGPFSLPPANLNRRGAPLTSYTSAGEMEYLLSNMRHSTDWQVEITLHDCYWPNYPTGKPHLSTLDCYDEFSDKCELSETWTRSNDTCFVKFKIPTPYTFVGAPTFRIDFEMEQLRFTSISTRIDVLGCGRGWKYLDDENACQMLASTFQKVAYVDVRLGNVLAGAYTLAIQTTYVVRKTEETGAKPIVRSYISISSQQFSTAPSATVKTFMEHTNPGYGAENGGFSVSIQIFENSMWIFQTERRIIQFFDGVSLLVVTLIVFFNVIRLLATIEKKLTEKLCPPKLHEYELLVDKTH